MRAFYRILIGVCFCSSIFVARDAGAGIIASGFFSGTIESFDEQTMAQSTFATIASVTDPFPGLSGIAYSSQSNQIFASARISNRIYTVDAATGAVLGFTQLGASSAPAGIAVDAFGNRYVANNGGNTVSVFDSNWNPVRDIALPNIGLGDNLPSGLAFDSQGRLLISTFAGGGVFRYDPGTDSVSSFAASPLANGQVAVDSTNNVIVGGAAFSNDVLKFGAAGSPIGNPFLAISAATLPQPGSPYTSPDFTSPSGVGIDANGNLIVAALGRTNPFSASDNFQNNGGLFKFDSNGTLLGTFATGITPLSGIAFIPTAVPEPRSVAMLIVVGSLAVWARFRRRTVV